MVGLFSGATLGLELLLLSSLPALHPLKISHLLRLVVVVIAISIWLDGWHYLLLANSEIVHVSTPIERLTDHSLTHLPACNNVRSILVVTLYSSTDLILCLHVKRVFIYYLAIDSGHRYLCQVRVETLLRFKIYIWCILAYFCLLLPIKFLNAEIFRTLSTRSV